MNFEGVAPRRASTRDPATAVGPFAEVLRGADLAVGNLETAIATGGTRADKQFAFRAPPPAVDALRAAGFDAVEHGQQPRPRLRPRRLEETLAVKRAQADGFLIGIGGDEDEAFAPFTRRGARASGSR